jgi:replicative DNA helicase
MIGLQAERNLLIAVITAPRQYRFTEGLVSRHDFMDDRLGIIYEQIGHMVAKGLTVGFVEVVDRFPEWGVRNLDFAELISWDDGTVYSHGAAEYARHVRSESLRRVAANIGRVLVEESRDAGIAPADILTKGRGALESALDNASSGLLQAVSLSQILEGQDSYDWVVPGLLERQDRLILTGSEGTGKSTFSRQLCVLSAAGLHPTKFTPIDPVKVLVVDAENTEKQWRRASRWMARRAKEMGVVDPTERVMVAAGKRIDVTRGSHLGEIHRLVDLHKPDMLYIGPLYKITSGAIMTDDDAAPLLVALDSLRERGLTLLMEAHAAKGASESVREWRPRGSAALMGWPEFGLGLSKLNEGGDVELVRWRGDRDEREWPTFMRRGYDWPWEPADG